MRFTVEYPIGSPGFDPRFLEPATITRVVRALEDTGIDAVGFTEHPAPSRKWLEGGGHESFDPLTALAFCAATTSRIKLMTFLLVLPYRNPLLAAKQIATTDTLSGGRLIVAAGSGYLRSEFSALGVDFDERNVLFDEALEVITRLWSADEFEFAGRHFQAMGQVSVPPPVQRPHPPIWIGGNSRLARRRAATLAQGWSPLFIDERMARTTRTPVIADPVGLRRAVDDMRSLAEDVGRDPSALDVQVRWSVSGDVEADAGKALETLGELAAAGATWVVLNPPNGDVDRCVDLLSAYGDQVINHAR
jgi:probable F420-dependent oxidoreductase